MSEDSKGIMLDINDGLIVDIEMAMREYGTKEKQ